jgi:hypothetical protein
LVESFEQVLVVHSSEVVVGHSSEVSQLKQMICIAGLVHFFYAGADNNIDTTIHKIHFSYLNYTYKINTI